VKIPTDRKLRAGSKAQRTDREVSYCSSKRCENG
jgi:hypothetical protein